MNFLVRDFDKLEHE